MKTLTETEQWRIDQAFSASASVDLLTEGAASEHHALYSHLVASMAPFLQPHHSPIPAIFSFESKNSTELMRKSQCLLRDGLLPLAWFFEGLSSSAVAQINSGPAEFLIHSSLGGCVPEALRKNVKYFELYAEKMYDAKNAPENLLITAIASPEIMSLHETKCLLQSMMPLIKNNRLKQISVFLISRKFSYSSQVAETYDFELAQLITQQFSQPVTFLNRKTVLGSTFKNTALVDLNSYRLYSDSSLTHHLLRKGVGLLGTPKPKKGSASIRLSPFHGYTISKKPAPLGYQPVAFDDEVRKFVALKFRDVRAGEIKTPWPAWFFNYARTIYPFPWPSPELK